MEIKAKKIKLDDESALLTFLKMTKDGKYAPIDVTSLTYTRVGEEREEIYGEEDFVYSVS